MNSDSNHEDIEISQIFERPRYFYNQLLTEEDLNQEQTYQINKRNFNNLHLHGSGIVCGLEVIDNKLEIIANKDSTEFRVKISSGFAVDDKGQEIIVPYTKEYLGKKLFSNSDDQAKDICLFIKRADKPRNKVFSSSDLGSGMSENTSSIQDQNDNFSYSDSGNNNRIRENFELVLDRTFLKSTDTINNETQNPSQDLSFPSIYYFDFDKNLYHINDLVTIRLSLDPKDQSFRSRNLEVLISNLDDNAKRKLILTERSGYYEQTLRLISSSQDKKNGTKSTAQSSSSMDYFPISDQGDILTAEFEYENSVKKISVPIVTGNKFYDKKILSHYYFYNESRFCYSYNKDFDNINNGNNGRILIAVLRKKDVKTFTVDQHQTSLYRKINFNNSILFDILLNNILGTKNTSITQGYENIDGSKIIEKSITSKQIVDKAINLDQINFDFIEGDGISINKNNKKNFVEISSTISSKTGKGDGSRVVTGIALLENIKRESYLITRPIKHFCGSVGPPLVQLGRLDNFEAEKDPYNARIKRQEHFSIVGTRISQGTNPFASFSAKLKPNSEDDESRARELGLHNFLRKDPYIPLYFTAIDITKETFRIFLIRPENSEPAENEELGDKVFLQWWAICPNYFHKD